MAPTEFHFHGGGTVLHPNHITRYIYPSLLYPKAHLILQPPLNSPQRPRPQGQTAWDTTFCTISPAPKSCPTDKQLQTLAAEKKKDRQSENAVGRAMRRVTAYPGNTTLECGKFKLGGPRMVFVIRRTTVWPLGGELSGEFAREEEVYEIPAERWRDLMPLSADPDMHDCWWVRLHDLINQSHDRAYWNVQKRLDELQIAEPIRQWLPRQDIAQQNIKILYNEATANIPDDEKQCPVCLEDYFHKADFPVRLPCNHYICLTDMISMHDDADGALAPNEQGPNSPFWRCPVCRNIMPITHNRLDTLHPTELPYWRWRTMHNYMTDKMAGRDFNTLLALSVAVRYIPDFPRDQNNGAEIAVTRVRYRDAVDFMQRFVIPVARLLPWGYSTDNPVMFLESRWLVEHLKRELRRLEGVRRKFKLQGLIGYLNMVAAEAFKPVVVREERFNLGNPIFPPGYEMYRTYLCEWTARGCFLAPRVVKEHKEFVARMVREQGVWWKGHPFLRG